MQFAVHIILHNQEVLLLRQLQQRAAPLRTQAHTSGVVKRGDGVQHAHAAAITLQVAHRLRQLRHLQPVRIRRHRHQPQRMIPHDAQGKVIAGRLHQHHISRLREQRANLVNRVGVARRNCNFICRHCRLLRARNVRAQPRQQRPGTGRRTVRQCIAAHARQHRSGRAAYRFFWQQFRVRLPPIQFNDAGAQLQLRGLRRV